MTVWLVRAGKHGENENLALENGCVIIGWEDLSDLTPFDARDKLANALVAVYPGSKPNTLRNWESQIWPIRSSINKGDVVVLPLKSRSDIALGRQGGSQRGQGVGRESRSIGRDRLGEGSPGYLRAVARHDSSPYRSAF